TNGGVRCRRTRDHGPVELVVVGRIERGADESRRNREAPTVDQRTCERMVLRELQRRVTEEAADLALGRDEVGASRRVADVLVGGKLALGGVAVEQAVVCLPM